MNVAEYYIRNVSAINTVLTSEIRAYDVIVVVVVVVVIVVVVVVAGRITDLRWPQEA